jgi:hypothetical protein
MGSIPSSGVNKRNGEVKIEEKVANVVENLKNNSIVKEIVENVETENLALKPSQTVNLEKIKNETKVKKVRDIRSLQTLKDIKMPNNENEPCLF